VTALAGGYGQPRRVSSSIGAEIGILPARFLEWLLRRARGAQNLCPGDRRPFFPAVSWDPHIMAVTGHSLSNHILAASAAPQKQPYRGARIPPNRPRRLPSQKPPFGRRHATKNPPHGHSWSA